MTSPEKILDYDKLVDAYSVNLDVTLRGFKPAEEMLDTWVPDDDPIQSLANLFEAAQLCGSNAVSVRVSNKTLESHCDVSLKEKLASLGEVTVEPEAESTVFTVSHLQETASFRSVRPIYQKALRARVANLRFIRPLRVEGNQIPLKASDENFSLAWVVDPAKHVITDAVTEGTKGPMLAALDQLCEVLVGLPVDEAREHAVVRLEFALRDKAQRHPISGIVLPRNADPIFRLPSALVTRLFDDYCTSTQYRPAMNFFDPGPRPSWAAMSPEDRKTRVAEVFAKHGNTLGLHNGEVQVVECKHSYDVTIHFKDELPIPQKRKLALDLERLVRQHCDPRLEIFCEEKKDLSKLRRL
jgi:hypothetical protein